MAADLIQFSPAQLILACVAVFLAYAVKGFSGFGAGLVAIPLLALVLPVHIAVPAVSVLSYGGNIAQSFALWKDTSWRDVLPLFPFSLLGVVTAVWLLVSIDATVLALALGVFLFLYAAYSLIPAKPLTGSRYWAIPIGSAGGLIGALFGSGGFIYVVYLKLRGLDTAGFRGSVAMTLFIDNSFRVAAYSGVGLYTLQTLILVALLVPVMLAAMLAGHHLHLNVNHARFNQVISILLMVSSALLIYKSLR